MTVSALPIMVVDIGGSVLMIALSALSLGTAFRLKQRDPNTIIWAYLFWVCIAMTIFAVSRSAGHIVSQALVLTGYADIWSQISPYSGAVNTITFVVVGSVTLFFERTWMIYQQMEKNQRRLENTHNELVYLNQNLEQLVAKRTNALAASEHKYRRIFEVSRDVIVVTRDDGSIIDINAAGCQLFGLVLEEPDQPKSLLNYLAQPSDWRSIQRMLKKQGFITARELDMKDGCGDSRRVILSASVAHEPAAGGNTVHFLIKDIEHQRQMREQMAQADKLASIGEFSSGIAHEINNPLGVILGYTQLLLRDEKADSDRRRDLKIIEKHVRSCKTIVEDLLNFARRSPTKKTEANINEVIADVLGFVRQHANMNQITFEEVYAENLAPLIIDEKKIKQVFINLFMNAAHAVDNNGKISIRTRMCKGGRHVKIDVRDNGHGIERRNLSRIFDPFFTTKPTGEGTGLGLSVSYGIVRHHGGNITVKSEIGKGAVFTVELPVNSQKKEKTVVPEDPGRRR